MRRFPVFAALVFASGSALAQMPAAIEPPSPSVLAASYAASGVQIYACKGDGDAAAWVLQAPDAELGDASGAPVIHHFAGPTWQARDGSMVVGTLVAKSPSPAADAIAWLLLRATATGQGILAGTRYVVRRDTRGGAAPAGRCTAGGTARVPYTATYAFYR